MMRRRRRDPVKRDEEREMRQKWKKKQNESTERAE